MKKNHLLLVVLASEENLRIIKTINVAGLVHVKLNGRYDVITVMWAST